MAIQIIDGGAWISIRFITADVKKGSGGKILEFAKARICRNRVSSPSPLGEGRGEAFSPPLSSRREAGDEVPSTWPKASPEFAIAPNHNFHFTRNLELPNKQIRKVHPILITHINQEEVI